MMSEDNVTVCMSDGGTEKCLCSKHVFHLFLFLVFLSIIMQICQHILIYSK